MVIVHHIEIYKEFFHISNYSDLPFFQVIGKLGVVLFFVLSGFLITTLLLNEKKLNETISFKKFYIRRILRIWPVYYLIVIIGFFVYPHIHFFDLPENIFPPTLDHFVPKLVLFLTIFANLSVAVYGHVNGTSQTWSLATEEQFYLVWPLVVNVFKSKLIPAILTIISVYYIIYYLSSSPMVTFIPLQYKEIINKFCHFFNINCMAIGSLFAILIFNKSKYIKIIFDKRLFFVTCFWTITSLIFGVNYGFFHYDVYALMFGIIISNLSFNPLFKKSLENRITSYLGSISYGMYMYQFIGMNISLKAAVYFKATWFIYPLTFAITIVISHLSFQYFEAYFLRLKKRFV